MSEKLQIEEKIKIKMIFPSIDSMLHSIINRLSSNEQVGITSAYTIFGGRGSGKTTVLEYMIKTLNERLNEAIVIKTKIEPELINDDRDILGWVIGLLREKLEQQTKCEDIFGVPKAEKPNDRELLESYWSRKKMNVKDYLKDLSKQELLAKQGAMLKADIKLREEFKKYIEAYVSFIHKKNGKCGECYNVCDKRYKCKKCPKVIFFFDDIDIYSGRTYEILETIRVFLDDTNIISIVTGDESEFKAALTLQLMQLEQVSDSLFIEPLATEQEIVAKNHFYHVRFKRSEQYLKKVLPLAQRYDINRISNRDKKVFIPIYKKENTSIVLHEQLKQLPFLSKDLKEILLENNIDFYKAISDLPRDLVNLYELLREKNEPKKRAEKNEQEKQIIEGDNSETMSVLHEKRITFAKELLHYLPAIKNDVVVFEWCHHLMKQEPDLYFYEVDQLFFNGKRLNRDVMLALTIWLAILVDDSERCEKVSYLLERNSQNWLLKNESTIQSLPNLRKLTLAALIKLAQLNFIFITSGETIVLQLIEQLSQESHEDDKDIRDSLLKLYTIDRKWTLSTLKLWIEGK